MVLTRPRDRQWGCSCVAEEASPDRRVTKVPTETRPDARVTRGPDRGASPSAGATDEGRDGAGEGAEARLDLAHVVEQGRSEDGSLGGEAGDLPGDADGMATIGAGHPSPQLMRPGSGDQDGPHPRLVVRRGSAGAKRPEEPPGEMTEIQRLDAQAMQSRAAGIASRRAGGIASSHDSHLP